MVHGLDKEESYYELFPGPQPLNTISEVITKKKCILKGEFKTLSFYFTNRAVQSISFSEYPG